MTALIERPPERRPPVGPEFVRSSGPRAQDRARLALHAVAVAAILTVGALFVGTDGVVSADEGAVLAQVDVLQRTGRYGMEYWADDVDPTGRWFPFHLAERHGDRWYLFTKKPAYVELVSLADRVAGRWGIIVLHASGVALAAWAAARVAGHLRTQNTRRLRIVTLWITGLGSPLIMDGAWVIGHGPAAAAAGLVAIGMARWWTRPSPRGVAWLALGLVAGILLRNEATLLGAAVTLAALPNVPRAQAGEKAHPLHAKRGGGWGGGTWASAMAVVAGGATALGVIAATAWQRAVEGGSASGGFRIREQVGWMEGRVLAFWNILWSPDRDGAAAGWWVFAATALVAIGWSAPVRRQANGRWTAGLTAAAAVALIVRLNGAPAMIPALFAAFPIGVAALAVVWPKRAKLVGQDLPALLARVWIAFALAVLVTSYSSGGTGDWGGRYLHIGLPFITPVIAMALVGVVERQPNLRAAALLLAAASVVIGVIGHSAFRQASTTTEILASVPDSTQGPSANPVVVSTNPAYGRWAWDRVATGRYLTVLPDDPEVDSLIETITPALIIGSPADAAELVDRIERASMSTYRHGLVSQRWSVWVLAADDDA